MMFDTIGLMGEPSKARRPGQTRPTRRILVADDEPVIRSMIRSMLAGAGHHVDVVEDGAAAWAALQAQSYDLLVTDHNMPRMTGLELVRQLRSARMALPVMLVAGAVPEDELQQDPSLQIAATLSKPFEVGELLGTVETVLRAYDDPREQAISG
jgi:two-component system, sensor histidine kinase